MRSGWTAGLLVLVAAACQDFAQPAKCPALPAPGCPISQGGTCDDKACGAIYSCVDGAWVLEGVCEREAGVPDAAAESAADGPGCADASVQLEGGATGCDPNDVIAPDCPVNVLVGCPQTACLSGCVDFFQCRVEGWTLVAWCDEETGQVNWVDGVL